MPQWVNFKQIRQQVLLSAVLFELYGLTNLTVKDGKAIGPCPVHGGDSPRAFHADLERNIWHCFTKCQGGGNQLDFVAKKEKLSIRDAALRLQQHFLAGSTASAGAAVVPAKPSPSAEPKAAVPAANKPISVRLRLYADHPHIAERGLTQETAEYFGIGYCRRGIMRGCIAIPIYNEDGELIAYAGRRLKPQDVREHGKYKLPKGFAKDQVLFNLHRALPLAQADGLVLVEGYFQAFFLHQLGFENVAATMGASLSEAQAGLIRTLGIESVTVLFDGDAAGRSGAAKVEQALMGDCIVRVGHLPVDRSVDELPADVVRWLLTSLVGPIRSLSFSLSGEESEDE